MWPFKEPVKEDEYPDYYEIIRYPIGECVYQCSGVNGGKVLNLLLEIKLRRKVL